MPPLNKDRSQIGKMGADR